MLTPRVAVLGLLCAAAGVHAQDAKTLAVRSLAASCAQCHGTDGHAVTGSAVPGLAGKPAAEIADRLKAFQRGERPSTIMQQLAKGYSDAQIEALARWFSMQPP
jgi:cytochrome c553